MKTTFCKAIGRTNIGRISLMALASQWQMGAASAQTFTTLKSFGSLTTIAGTLPDELVQGADGALYGTTWSGGHLGLGTVFALNLLPSLTIVPDGAESVRVLWPDPGNFTLQQSPNLGGTNGWVTSGYPITTADGTSSITVTPATGNLFFRLKQETPPAESRPPLTVQRFYRAGRP